MPRKAKQPEYVPDPNHTFGPCHYCDYPLTHGFCSHIGAKIGPLVPTCDWCVRALGHYRVFEDEMIGVHP